MEIKPSFSYQAKLLTSAFLLFSWSQAGWAQAQPGTPVEAPKPVPEEVATDKKKKPAAPLYEVVRVPEPGIFHVKAGGLEVRLKAWGIGCPKRDQPIYREALRFAEDHLLGLKVKLEVKREFDPDGYKQVMAYPEGDSVSFNRAMITNGYAWHMEKVTKRLGGFAIAQIRAKRNRTGVWGQSFAYDFEGSADAAPKPSLPSLLRNQNGSAARIMYWQSFIGKIHRPGCAFYSKGNGILTPNPQGRNCGVCGGLQGSRR
jgi:endonuclease YncB( thermonuclease family)